MYRSFAYAHKWNELKIHARKEARMLNFGNFALNSLPVFKERYQQIRWSDKLLIVV